MGERVRAVRSNPDGDRIMVVLDGDADGKGHVLRIRSGGGDRAIRELPGTDLSAALVDAYELTGIDAATRLEIICSDREVHERVVAALCDPNPSVEFADEAWPEGTKGLPETDEWPIDGVVRHRWITIDGDSYYLLPVDRTRAVHVEDGEIRSGVEVASASWSFDGDMTSSTGSESLRLVGGDTLVRQNLGDDVPETTVELFDGDMVSAIVNWLDDNAYAAAFLIETSAVSSRAYRRRAVGVGPGLVAVRVGTRRAGRRDRAAVRAEQPRSVPAGTRGAGLV